jgi:hypothetical protein
MADDSCASSSCRRWMAAAGATATADRGIRVEAGWRRAALMASFDRGATWQELGKRPGPAVMGRVETVLPARTGRRCWIGQARSTVDLLHAGMLLEARATAALAAGANLALVGDEIIQFGAAEAIGAGRFRLSSLLRGRFGPNGRAARIRLERTSCYSTARCCSRWTACQRPWAQKWQVRGRRALRTGRRGVKVTRRFRARRFARPVPVTSRASRNADGGVAISWARRSRSGWAWVNGGDAPLGEQSEAYEVTIRVLGSNVGRGPRSRATSTDRASRRAMAHPARSRSRSRRSGTHARSRNATRILFFRR